jgi:DUF1365 family protein
MHHRLAPRQHRFRYGIFMLCLDLDELPTLDARLHTFSRNRWNLYAFRDSDHLEARSLAREDGGASPGRVVAPGLKGEITDWLVTQGVSLPTDARITLVTLPRVLGYIFNPVSFYFCHTAGGAPLCAVTEVQNTFGELKPYLVPLDAEGPDSAGNDRGRGGEKFRRTVPKHFYVSPFSGLDVCFDFRLRTPGERLEIGVNDVTTEGQTLLVSTLTGTRRPLTDGQLLRLTAKYPLVTLRVITLIHWQALRLWWKRLPWHPKAARAALQRDLYRPHGSLKRSRPDEVLISPAPVSVE